jgi:hypothetical protein
MEGKEFRSGTFILPPKAEHETILAELESVVLNQATHVRGYPVKECEARSVLALYSGLDEVMRDSLLSRTIPDMLAATLRCRALSENDPSWTLFERKVG